MKWSRQPPFEKLVKLVDALLTANPLGREQGSARETLTVLGDVGNLETVRQRVESHDVLPEYAPSPDTYNVQALFVDRRGGGSGLNDLLTREGLDGRYGL